MTTQGCPFPKTMDTQGNTFPKTERLCSRKAIEALFAGGTRAFSAFPLRVVYKVINDPATAQSAPRTQVLISVSKRHFKHAIDRNRAKRQIREAWRLNRDIIPSSLPSPLWGRVGEGAPHPSSLHIAFIWLADEPQPTALVQRKMKNLLHRVAEQLDEVSERRINGLTE